MVDRRKEINEQFTRAVFQDTIARLTAEGKLPPLPAPLPDLIAIHIGYENLP